MDYEKTIDKYGFKFCVRFYLTIIFSFPGNPYDRHTLSRTLEQVERIAFSPEHTFTNQGFRGHDYQGPVQVYVAKKRRGRTALSLWKWMRRKVAIEPAISHLKHEHRLNRNRIKGMLGDCLNTIFSAAGMNFRKLLRWAAALLRLILASIYKPVQPAY